MREENPRLRDFQEKYERSLSAYSEKNLFKDRLAQYQGTRTVRKGKDVDIVWNFTFELLESQIDSNIPKPKVTSSRPTERTIRNAQVIEDMLRCEIDRLPFEAMNDEDERNVKIFGGSGFLVEWDNEAKTHDTIGALSVRLLSANQIIPQHGVLETRYMDYIFLTFDDTKSRIKARYGKDVDDESTDAQVSEFSATDDTVTQIVCFYQNKNGNLGFISWVNDVILTDDDNYEARKDSICVRCGRTKIDKVCVCGSTEFDKRPADGEELKEDIQLSDGRVVPAMSPVIDDNGDYVFEEYEEQVIDAETGLPLTELVFENGLAVGETPVTQPSQRAKLEPTTIPHYYPRKSPVVIRKNVSVYNKFLGDSDCDVIRDFQEGANKLLTKVNKKLLKAGSYLAKPHDLNFQLSDDDVIPINIENVEQLARLKAINLEFNVEQDLAAVDKYYYMAKSVLGVTDSFQGKADTTAQSGKAKEIQVAQAAGRQMSKKVMKNAMYADLYEMMFKFMLAYTDEPRVYTSIDEDGQQVQRIFNKYDFLEQDESGNWYYCDDYTFSVDESGVDSNNKQFMLEDVRQDFSMGAFGNPQDPRTMLRYWKEKEVIGYPNAKRNVKEWERVIEEMQQMEQQQDMQQNQSQQIDMMIEQMPEELRQQALQNPQMLEEMIAQQIQ